MDPTEQIPDGAEATEARVVTRELTVGGHHAGMPEVYGTPMMIHLMETAAAAAIQPYLPEGWVSVGTHVDVRHLAATPVGMTVRATARVTARTPRTVTFEVEAHDGVERIGAGKHQRAPIDLARFERRAAAKAGGGGANR